MRTRTALLALTTLAAARSAPVRVLPCSFWNGGTDSEGWALTEGAAGAVTIANTAGGTTLCLDAGTAGTTPTAAPCDAASASQQWRTDHKGLAPGELHIYTGAAAAEDPAARCLMVAGSTYTLGPGLLLAPCAQTRFRKHAVLQEAPASQIAGLKVMLHDFQLWSVNGTSLVSHAGGCCGDIFETRPVCLAVDMQPRCADLKDTAGWCDAGRNASARAAALVGAMTLGEKASNMDSHNFGVPRLAVPPNVFSEALHGMCAGCGAPHTDAASGHTSTGCPTSFPQVISMGASWNRSLWSAVGVAVSDEVRGLYAQGSAVGWESALFLWAPNVNPFRDPRWGRGQEVASEEPLVCAEYAAHYIPALQGRKGPDAAGRSFLKTVATVKHFFDYDLEGQQVRTY